MSYDIKKIQNIIPGFLAGITSVTLGYPFETMKTNLQISPYTVPLKIYIKKEVS